VLLVEMSKVFGINSCQQVQLLMESTVPRVTYTACRMPPQYCVCCVFAELPGALCAPSGPEHAVLFTDKQNTAIIYSLF